MNRSTLLVLCLATLVPLAANATGTNAVEVVDSKDLKKALLLSVEGSVVIETDGSVGEYTITSKTTPEIDALLQKAIPRWRFEPVLVEDKASRARAKMRLSLAAVESGREYSVGIENVVFPEGMSATDQARASRGAAVEAIGRRMDPPMYPDELMRAGVTGRVLLGLHFAPDGRMLDVVPVQTMLFGLRRYRRAENQAVRQFEQAAVDAARLWRVEVRQKPGLATTERDFTAYTTIEYVLTPTPRPGTSSNDAPPGQWREATRTPKRVMPWLVGLETPDIGVADLASGEFIPLAGGPKLKTPLAAPAN